MDEIRTWRDARDFLACGAIVLCMAWMVATPEHFRHFALRAVKAVLA